MDIHRYEPLWGRWSVGELIGQGSYGKVYRCTRNEFGNDFVAAVKIISIPPDEKDLETARQDNMSERSMREFFAGIAEDFLTEIRLMNSLKGLTNVVSFEDYLVEQHEDGIGWDILIRMEYLTPLFKHIDSHPMTEQDVVKLGTDIAQAMEQCQRAKVIHRDIKPDNIFISEYGDYKLGDFGIARQLERTQMNMSQKGTYSYMAPEVFKGEPYDVRADIYSTGLVLYRLLNNMRLPFFPDPPERITHKVQEEAFARRMRGEEIPLPATGGERLARVVQQACAYDTDRRFRTPVAFRKALENAAKDDQAAIDRRDRGSQRSMSDNFYTPAAANRTEPPYNEGDIGFEPLQPVPARADAYFDPNPEQYDGSDRQDQDEQLYDHRAYKEADDRTGSRRAKRRSPAALIAGLTVVVVLTTLLLGVLIYKPWKKSGDPGVTGDPNQQWDYSQQDVEDVVRQAILHDTPVFQLTAGQTPQLVICDFQKQDEGYRVRAGCGYKEGSDQRLLGVFDFICYFESPQGQLTVRIDQHWRVDGPPAFSSASATSELAPNGDYSYGADKLIDKDLDTAWVEGAEGLGIGEQVTLHFPHSTEMHGLEIVNGYVKTQWTFEHNARVTAVQLYFSDGTTMDVYFDDAFYTDIWVYTTAPIVIYFDRVITTDRVTIEILGAVAYGYSRDYEDTCITEITAF